MTSLAQAETVKRLEGKGYRLADVPAHEPVLGGPVRMTNDDGHGVLVMPDGTVIHQIHGDIK